jgi:hypothetical protein
MEGMVVDILGRAISNFYSEQQQATKILED